VESIASIQQQVAQRLGPDAEAMTLLQTIPAIQEVAAAAIISEIGVDMERFPSAKHLARLRRGLPGE
jgi:transposase